MTHKNAMRVILAWQALDEALAGFNVSLVQNWGVTGAQLAMLRIVAESAPVTIRDLRRGLHWHPATLGQLLGRLEDKGLAEVRPDSADRRRRVVVPTAKGRRVLTGAPLAGPVRLRTQMVDPAALDRMRLGFEEAIAAFGLEPWVRSEEDHA